MNSPLTRNGGSLSGKRIIHYLIFRPRYEKHTYETRLFFTFPSSKRESCSFLFSPFVLQWLPILSFFLLHTLLPLPLSLSASVTVMAFRGVSFTCYLFRSIDKFFSLSSGFIDLCFCFFGAFKVLITGFWFAFGSR